MINQVHVPVLDKNLKKKLKIKPALKGKVLRLVLNLVADDDCIMSNGRMLHFHSFSPATEYALLQYVLRVAMGSSSNWLLEDLNT